MGQTSGVAGRPAQAPHRLGDHVTRHDARGRPVDRILRDPEQVEPRLGRPVDRGDDPANALDRDSGPLDERPDEPDALDVAGGVLRPGRTDELARRHQPFA